MRRIIGRHHDDGGFSSAVGLVAMVVGLGVVAVLLLVSMNTFGGGNGASSGRPSILSRSPAESQLKLCAEGRDSTYGSPPTPAQQSKCVSALAGQVSGGGPAAP